LGNCDADAKAMFPKELRSPSHRKSDTRPEDIGDLVGLIIAPRVLLALFRYL